MSSPDKNGLFGLIGAAGFVVRHMEVIQFNGQKLVALFDPMTMGVPPSLPIFSLNSNTLIGIDKRRRTGSGIDYLSICSPNHCTTAIYVSACALVHTLSVRNHGPKPVNLDALGAMERESDKSVYSTATPFAPSIIALNPWWRIALLTTLLMSNLPTQLEVIGTTPHGKQIVQTKASLPTLHSLFDTLLWIFVPMKESKLFVCDNDRASGYLELKRARIKWFLHRCSNPTSI